MRLHRIRDRRSFLRLRTDGARRRSGPVVVTALAAAEGTTPRAAFAIGRKVGPAVVRNRIRRRLRAALQDLDLPAGDYLVSAGAEAAELPFAALRDHLGVATSAAHEASQAR